MNEFVKAFASQFDDTPLEQFSLETEFRKIDEWSSLLALCVIAMADEHYNVKLTGDDIRNSNTIQDILNVISQRKS